MKCMVLEKFNAPLVLREREIPTCGADEVLLRVGACGLCRTDLKVCHGTQPSVKQLPLVPGHEVAGEVVEVGTSVSKELIGKHAVVYFYLSCGDCEFCRAGSEILCSGLRGQIGYSLDGGYAEYVKVPANSLFFIRSDIPFQHAAIVTDAIATPYRALTGKAKIRPGEILAVIGAGGLGIHAIQIARALGATAIAIDIKERALALAKEVGAEKTFLLAGDETKAEIFELFHEGVDVAMDFVAKPETQVLALNLLRKAGRFVVIAYNTDNPFPVNSRLLVSKELRIYGSRSCGRSDLQETIELVSSSKVKPIVTASYPLAETNLALARLERGELVGRSVLVP